MDSGNSGSLQSSSGGDDEYDSRADSISAFLNNPLTQVGLVNNPPQNNHHQTHQPSGPLMFDPFDSSSRSPLHFSNPNSLLNLDMVNWSRSLRSDPDHSPDLAGLIAPSPPTTHFARPTLPPLQIPGSGSASGFSSGSGLNTDQTNNSGSGAAGGSSARNPKKRSRASRRAPTTVLTTDTSNFRAMVQEFTGIPAPPFSSSSFPRSRLDLFGNSATFRTHFDPPSPPYLLRPFAHKIQPSLITSTSVANTTVSSSSTTSNLNSGSATNTDNLGLFNPVLNFHPLFQPSPKFPISNPAAPATHSPLKIGGYDAFGLSHGGPVNNNLSELQNNWGGGGGGEEEGLLRSMNGGNCNTSQRVANASGDKGPQNVAARTEGTMEPWICSSD